MNGDGRRQTDRALVWVMCLEERPRRACGPGLVVTWLLLLAVTGASAVDVSMAPEVTGHVGEDLELKCNFRSSAPITRKLTVEWAYQPLHTGPQHSILYYQAGVYPASQSPLKDRVAWIGDVSRGNASIVVRNLTLADNGTFSCSVRNPPDTLTPARRTVLSVTERAKLYRMKARVFLSLLVLLPSLVTVMTLLLWTGKVSGVLGSRPPDKGPGTEGVVIDVGDGDGGGGGVGERGGRCQRMRVRCAACLEYSDDDDNDDEDFHRYYPESPSPTGN